MTSTSKSLCVQMDKFVVVTARNLFTTLAACQNCSKSTAVDPGYNSCIAITRLGKNVLQ